MEEKIRKSGIDILGDVPWGTHLCQFYQTKGDLIDILTPYFKAGLENNEFCMWVTSEPLRAEEAEKSLRKAVKNLDKYIKRDQIEIMDYSQWFTKSGKFAADEVLRGWVNKENKAVKGGFDGLRLAGNTFWLEEKDWRDFADYEVAANNVLPKYRMLAVCSYSLDKCGASEVIDVVNSHQYALIRREGKWEVIESSERKKAEIALEEKEAFNFALFQYNPIQTIVVDNEGKVIKSNLAIKNSGDRLPNIGDMMYRDYAGKHEIDMRAELMECIRTGKKKDFAELKYGDNFLNVTIATFPQGAIIISQDITKRKRAEEEIKRRNEEFATLNAISATVSSSLNLQEILDRALDKILEVAGVKVGSIYLLDQQANELVLATYRGVSKEFANQVRTFKMGESLTGRVGQSGEPIVIDDLAKDRRVTTTVVSEEGIRSMASLPIKSKDKVLGVVNLASHKYHRFSSEEIRLYVAVANQIGVAVENGWLYQIAQQELAERNRSEEGYRTVIRTAMNGFWLVNRQGRFLNVNDAYCRLIGYSRDELLKMKIQDIEAAETPEETAQHIRRIMATGGDRFETEHRCKDGKIIDVEVSVNYLKEADGRMFVFLRDITERKHAAEKLQESERRFKELWDNAPVAYHTVDAGGIITSVNKTEAKLLRYKPEEMVGRPIFDFILPEQKEEAIKRFKKKIAGEFVPRAGNRIYVRKDGSKVYVMIDDVLERDNKGQIIGARTTMVDVTERKQAEEALKESEERYRELVEKAELAILMDDEKGNFKYFNKKYAELFGYSYEEIKKQSIKTVVHPDEVERVMRIHRKRVQGKKVPSKYEFKGIKKDGSAIYLEVDAVELRDKNKIIGTRSYIWDITDRKRVEEDLKQSKEQMRNLADHLQSVREQERMLIAREIHDELAQSLTALKMDLFWLKNRTPADQKPLFERTEQMTQLVDTTIQRVKRISSELRPGLLDDLGLLAAIEWQGEEFESHTGIKCEMTNDAHDMELGQDFSMAVFRIFQEALTNVARHADATKVKVSLREKAGRLELKVRDNGKGIPERKISDPKSFGIVGMKERVYFLGGKIQIKGVQDKGTIIKMIIPLLNRGVTKR